MKRCGTHVSPEVLAWTGMIGAHEYIEMTNQILEHEVSSEARRLMRESALATHERLHKRPTRTWRALLAIIERCGSLEKAVADPNGLTADEHQKVATYWPHLQH
jgi:hypothetical protein